MQVTKQLSENEFVIRMDESDLEKNESFIIAHDYIRFFDNAGIMTSSDFEGKTYGKFAGAASNWIKARHETTIGIRDFIKIVLPRILENENCQEEHLSRENGTPAYTYNTCHLTFYENDVEKIALRKMGDTEYTIMDAATYRAIKNGEI